MLWVKDGRRRRRRRRRRPILAPRAAPPLARPAAKKCLEVFRPYLETSLTNFKGVVSVRWMLLYLIMVFEVNLFACTIRTIRLNLHFYFKIHKNASQFFKAFFEDYATQTPRFWIFLGIKHKVLEIRKKMWIL